MAGNETVIDLLQRLLLVMGGECEQGMPNPVSDMDGVGARTFMKGTLFDGTRAAVGASNVATATPLNVSGFAIHFAECFDVNGVPINAKIHVFYDKPSANKAQDFDVVRSGEWIKRRRGFNGDNVWITAGDDTVTIKPVIKVSTDPSYEVLGGGGACCEELPMIYQADHDDSGWTPAAGLITLQTFTVPVGGAGTWVIHWTGAVFGSAGAVLVPYNATFMIVQNGGLAPPLAIADEVGDDEDVHMFKLMRTAPLADGDVITFVKLDNKSTPSAAGFELDYFAQRVGP